MAYCTLAELRAYLAVRNSDTFTASAATDALTLTNPRITWSTGDEVVVSTTGTLPGGLAVSTTYYVIPVTDLTIKLAATSSSATAGTAIDITAAGSGTHTITRAATDDDLLQDCLDDAQAYIESQTGKKFEASASTIRYYRQESVDYVTLYLDEDLLTCTKLVEGDTDDTEITTGNYWLLPRNEGPPYRRIELKANSDYSFDWETDGEIEVTGTWGFSATPPADIKRATLVLAGYFYRQKDSQVWDVVAVPEAGIITIPEGIPRTVRRIIEKYQSPVE